MKKPLNFGFGFTDFACIDSAATFTEHLGKKALEVFVAHTRTHAQNAELVWNLTQDNLHRLLGKI